MEDLDPRFAQTIVYPGSVWMGETVKTDNTNVRFTNKQTGFIYKKYTVYTEQVPSDEEYRPGKQLFADQHHAAALLPTCC